MYMEAKPDAPHTRCMKFRIKEKRKLASLTQEDVADMLGISVSLYNGLETGKRRMNETYLEGLASIFKVTPSDLIVEARPTVALAGKVGAGAKVPLFDAYEKGDGPQIECPPAMPSSGVVAVEIEGDSMEPVFSAGDVLFYTRHTHENVPSEAIGRRSVCEDADGNVWVKQVKRGDEPDKFHLISLNPGAQTMWNVALKWASPIRLHWPKELVKKVTN